MKNFKKIISLILTAIMLMGMLSLSANAKSIEKYSTGDIIEFGSYPQSKVTDNATISALDAMSKNWISYGYYSGTGSCCDGQMKPSDYMKYCDISYNGSKYRAVFFSSYRPISTAVPLDNDTDNTYQDDNGYYIGSVYYFKYKPLRWRVLDPSEGFVMCEEVIDSQAYNNYVLYSDYEYWGDSCQTYYASDWANSSIRAWLNDDFYNTAFTSNEKSQIGTTYNENKSPYSNSYDIYSRKYDSADTSDKIFLLSYSEVLNTKYGFSSSNTTKDIARQIKSTDYAQCQGCQKTSSYQEYPWWLRSSFDSYTPVLVYGGGSVNDYYYFVDTTHCGIVPAFKFNPKSIIPESEIKEPVKAPDIKMSYKGTSKFTPSVSVGSDDIVEYKSSDISVAVVDKDGNITTVSKGTAEITCTVTDSAGNITAEETCTVNVKFQWWQWLIWIFLLGFLWY